MKISFRQFLPLLLASTGTALLPTATSAAGLLGKQWVRASYDFIDYESDAYSTSQGYTLAYNRPMFGKTDLGIEFHDFTRETNRIGVTDLTGKHVLATATLVGPTVETTPFLRVGLGWAETEFLGNTEDGLIYAIGIGAELPDQGRVSATCYVTWTDSVNSKIDGFLAYGVSADAPLSGGFDLFGKLEGDDHFNVTATGGVLFKF